MWQANRRVDECESEARRLSSRSTRWWTHITTDRFGLQVSLEADGNNDSMNMVQKCS